MGPNPGGLPAYGVGDRVLANNLLDTGCTITYTNLVNSKGEHVTTTNPQPAPVQCSYNEFVKISNGMLLLIFGINIL